MQVLEKRWNYFPFWYCLWNTEEAALPYYLGKLGFGNQGRYEAGLEVSVNHIHAFLHLQPCLSGSQFPEIIR